MKKLFITFILTLASFVYADYSEMLDLLELNQQVEEAKQQQQMITDYVDSYIYISTTTNPRILINATFAPAYTYLWYVNNDFNKATGFEKLEHFKQIEQLSY